MKSASQIETVAPVLEEYKKGTSKFDDHNLMDNDLSEFDWACLRICGIESSYVDTLACSWYVTGRSEKHICYVFLICTT